MPVMSETSNRPIRSVQVVLPSSVPADSADLAAGMAWLRAEGIDVAPPIDRVPYSLPFLAGPDLTRAQELAGALASDARDVVWCGRGGSGALRTLQALDEVVRWARASRHPTTPNFAGGDEGGRPHHPMGDPARRHVPLVGLSDATALLLARQRQSPPGVAIHGPVITQLPRLDVASAEALRTWLRYPDRLPVLRAASPRTVVAGTAEGPLIAGNLSLLAACCGTPEALAAGGAILLLEDVGEPAFRIDRLLAQLWRSGALRGVRGLAFGTWVDCRPDEQVAACLADWGERLGVPCCDGFPVGHSGAVLPVALGLRYKLLADDGVLAPLESLADWLARTDPNPSAQARS